MADNDPAIHFTPAQLRTLGAGIWLGQAMLKGSATDFNKASELYHQANSKMEPWESARLLEFMARQLVAIIDLMGK